MRFGIVSVVAVLLLWGCATSPEETLLGTTYTIDAIKFEGNSRFSKKALLDHMHSGETSWVPLTPDYLFNEALIAVDVSRIEALYHAHGYYQAVVEDIDFKIDDGDESVSLIVRIVEGEQSLVRRVAFDWATGSGLDEGVRGEIEALASIKAEGPFEVSRLNDSIGAMRLALQQRGYPLARTSGQADVNEGARVADIAFQLAPGPHARIGRVLFEGLEEVPQYMIDREVGFAVGEPFSPALASQVEQAVKAMRVFRWVSVMPTRAVDDEGLMDMRVRVSEAHPQSLSLGVQTSFEAFRWQQQLSAKYTHTNLFGHLTRLDMGLLAGWAELPDPFVADAHGPVIKFSPAFSKKGLLDDHLQWSLRPGFDVDIQEGYQYYSPSNRIGVSRWFGGGVLRGDVSHTLRFVDFFNLSPELGDNASLLGRDFRDPFMLSFLEIKADIYLVDTILNPNNGAIFGASYNLAGGPFGGNFDFHKFLVSAKGYWSPFGFLQFAARAQSGMIVPYGDDPGSPFNFKFYLGGADTVRGWGSRRLSPQLFDCPEGEPSCRGIPIGGFTMVQGNLEARLDVGAGFTLVGFADMGDVQAEDLTFDVSQWNYSAGPGLRFDSPVGLFRLDVGFRLNDTGVFPDEPTWSLYFGLGETF